jgi:ABC-type nitrate/sulfonate/bicarbonate transport system substrate-binding protein
VSVSVVRLSTFKGMQNLPVFVAEREGLFAGRGLAVEVAYTVGSAAQIGALVRGDCDLAQTAPDNVFNANDNPAAFGLSQEDMAPVVMLMGGSVGPLGLFAQKGIEAVSDLRDTVVGVDNPRSGFALVLRDILAGHDLLSDRDYHFKAVGGTSERLEALRSGAVAATILYMPFDALASAEGFSRLAGSEQQYAAYASLATAATAPWVAGHMPEATSYIAAIREALRLIHAPGYRARAQSIIRDVLHVNAATAALAYGAFVDTRTGFGAEARLDYHGLHTVIALRQTYGMPRSPLKDLAAYLEIGPYSAS